MNDILCKPGFISTDMGGEKLREMFQMRKCLLSPLPSTLEQLCATRTLSSMYEPCLFSFTPEYAEFDTSKLSPFAFACMCGSYDKVKEVCPPFFPTNGPKAIARSLTPHFRVRPSNRAPRRI